MQKHSNHSSQSQRTETIQWANQIRRNCMWLTQSAGKRSGFIPDWIKKWRELGLWAVGLKNSRHFFIQSGVKPKPTGIRSDEFSRALRQLHVITRSFDWFTGLSASLWLARVITLVLDLLHSIEDRSTPIVWHAKCKNNLFSTLKWKPTLVSLTWSFKHFFLITLSYIM